MKANSREYSWLGRGPRQVLMLAMTVTAVWALRHKLAGQTIAADTTATAAPHLLVDLGARKLYVVQGQDTVRRYDVAIGQNTWPTPRGSFTIRHIIWNPSWVPPDESWAKKKHAEPPGAAANPMKVVKIFFKEPGYYIHGTGDLGSLGAADSHGCLRMDPSDAYALARYIMENGGAPRDESWFWRVIHSRRETKEVYLDNPIALQIVSSIGTVAHAP